MSARARARSRPVRIALAALLGAFVLIQLVPYGHDHSAPASTKRAQLPPAAEQIARGACMDCHSNETEWPWYSNIAPPSLLVVNDVKGGRAHMNLSRWDRNQPPLDEIERVIRGGGMPPLQYKAIHGRARLDDGQRRALIAGFRSLYASDPPPQYGD